MLNWTAFDFRIDFEVDTVLRVNEESRVIVCFGNAGKETAMVQLSLAESDAITLRNDTKVHNMKRATRWSS